ncbi:hypothetical protein KIN20_026409 [Parelaphostrongylus tenuis]|uniref:Uncharacterized protein n=1 Tax=Parelaphostrongylus tenuis TaxID=148309 RepID=A0AAD5QY06_PARTN|nr:hypothetical protein KIN20_026409 [Parelaphostrongylus tenuis]
MLALRCGIRLKRVSRQNHPLTSKGRHVPAEGMHESGERGGEYLWEAEDDQNLADTILYSKVPASLKPEKILP